MNDPGPHLLNPEIAYYLRFGGGILIGLWLLGAFWRFVWLDASRHVLWFQRSLVFDKIKRGLQKPNKKRLNASADD